jgi:hypothetical protein
MQQLIAEAAAAAAAAAHGCNASAGSAAGGAAAVTGLSLSVDPPIPVQRFRVTGVLPRLNSSSSSGDTTNGLTSSSSGIGQLQQQQQQHGQAIVKAWRSAEVVQQLEEGLVVLAVALAAGNEGRSSAVDLGGMGRPVVELNTSNMTR